MRPQTRHAAKEVKLVMKAVPMVPMTAKSTPTHCYTHTAIYATFICQQSLTKGRKGHTDPIPRKVRNYIGKWDWATMRYLGNQISMQVLFPRNRDPDSGNVTH